MLSRRQFVTTATGIALGGGVLSACGGEEDPELAEGEVLRMRVWDEAAASAYRTALETFTADTGLEVEVEVLAWEDYWAQVPLDVAAETLPDVLWMNTANLAQLVDGEDQALLDAGALAGDEASGWEEAATELYRRDGTLWGVPQVFDRTVLLAHDELVAAAEGNPDELSFDPGADSDPLRELSRQLTVDGEDRHPGDEDFDAGSRSVIGFGAQPDRSAVLGPFIAGNGGAWQDDAENFVFGSEQGIAAVQYLADMATGHLAPDGTATAEDLEHCRSLFIDGTLALLQTGTYDLGPVLEGIDGGFGWSIHEAVAGPEGSRPLVHAVAAVAAEPEDEEREPAIGRLLAFLGTADGQRPLAQARVGIPAHRDLRSDWVDSWAEVGVDVEAVSELPNALAEPEQGVRSAEGTGAALPIIATVFTGEAEAAEAVPEAQQAALEAKG